MDYFYLLYYYNNGMGSATGAAQGKASVPGFSCSADLRAQAYVQKLVSRLTQIRLTSANGTSVVNTALNSDPAYFPLNQSIYADFTHEVLLLDMCIGRCLKYD